MCVSPPTRIRSRLRFVAGHVVVQLLAGSKDEPQEQSARLSGPGLVFRMELASNVERVALQFDDFHAPARLVLAHKLETLLLKQVDHLRVHLVPMPVPLVNVLHLLVQQGTEALGFLQEGPSAAQPHCPAHVRRGALWHEHDHRVGGGGIDFSAVRSLHPEHVPGKLDAGDLHAQADPEERLFRLSCVLAAGCLPLRAPATETSGDQDSVAVLHGLPSRLVLLQTRLLHGLLQVGGLDPGYLQLPVRGNGGVLQGLHDAKVRVGEARVLADHGNRYGVLKAVPPQGPLLPPLDVEGVRRSDLQLLADGLVHSLVSHHQGHVPDVRDVGEVHDVGRRHVAEQREFLLGALLQGLLASARQEVG
mmetsp:Transcript_8220/g.23468  ORF Transcript_8220/g.23468 Transcript_8220/m.23468 type:complete len:362 (+) Transcript_8220:1607-2692(+)